MKTFKDLDLYKFNTMRLHCIAASVFIPEEESDLFRISSVLKDCYFLGAGSNVILPAHIKKPVVVLSEVNKDIIFDGNIVTCGCSVRIQHFIRECQKKNLGGIEYLFSIPCNMGGATYMNAGRGVIREESIGKYITKVRCLNIETLQIEELVKEDCNFGYRESIFKNGGRVILQIHLKMNRKSADEIEKGIKERLEYAKIFLDDKKPSCGSVFCKANSKLLRFLKGLKLGGAKYSIKTSNWISNVDNAKNWQVIMLIKLAILLHRMTLRPYKLEVQIWK